VVSGEGRTGRGGSVGRTGCIEEAEGVRVFADHDGHGIVVEDLGAGAVVVIVGRR
jgi:hypothetical protein